jgi:hypothetical protein
MKKSLKLMLAFALAVTFNVNAKSIDVKGEYLPEDTLYKSGDVYTNVSDNYEYMYFYTRAGELHYYDPNKPVLLKPEAKGTRKLPIYEYRFVTDMYRYNVFGVENNKNQDLTIPTFYGKNIYWISGGLPSAGSPKAHVGAYTIERDYFEFYPYMSEVQYKVVCDKTELNLGEKANCKVYTNFDMYQGMYEARPDKHQFEIVSDDYKISNILGNRLTDTNVDGNKVSSIIDFDLLNSRSSRAKVGLELEGDDEVPRTIHFDSDIDDLININISCMKPTGEYYEGHLDSAVFESAPRLGSVTFPDEPCRYDADQNYNIELVSFEIEPKEDANEEGNITLANIQTKLSSSGYSDIELATLEADNSINNVPIKGIVKGVEEVTENPKTGIPNYVYILGIAVLFVVLYYNLIEKKFFKYHE